ncbi:hypothetical protein DPMN_017167 [Dreissena polymorpha]|uniref:Uncharacterized protein n=1 Tax=Dreissena polymorpha TaxID=45954 RepID=A0A9D4NAX0_DREPO|nr:hypothetical protein DPMN_017167 [Dreissena polymorpha]
MFSSNGLGDDLPLAFHEAKSCTVLSVDMSKQSQLSSFDGPLEGFLFAIRFCCHIPNTLIGLVLGVGGAKQYSEALH